MQFPHAYMGDCQGCVLTKTGDCISRRRERQRRGMPETPRVKRYPKVTARLEDEKITYQKETTALLMKVVESLSLESYSSPNSSIPGKPEPDARIFLKSQPDARIAQPRLLHKSATSSSSTSGEKGKGDVHAEADDTPVKNDEKPTRIRARSAPRPRAVLSSPDNDEMIGLMNKRSRERRSIQRTQDSRQRAPADRKSDITGFRMVTPAIKSKPSMEGHNDGFPKVKQSTQTKAMARQGSPMRKEWVF